MKYLPLLLALFTTVPALSQADPEISAFMGDWKGGFDDRKGDADLVARVIGLGNMTYRIQLLPEYDKRAKAYLDLEATDNNGRLEFKTDEWEGTITTNEFSGIKKESQGIRTYRLKKLERTSPTLGAKPPSEAIVLFDGSDLKEWMHPRRPGEKVVWKIVNDAMEVTPGNERINGKRMKNDLVTKHHFKNVKLHLEFCLPYQPAKRSQGRGNSGVFLQDFYEIQILDSYGTEGLWNDCGALYKLAPPKVNASYPPGTWQTYDVIYYSPVFDERGKCTRNAFITVKHNGVLIHNNVELTHPTAHSMSARNSGKIPGSSAPIKLQDHGNPVKFRNIWVMELKNK